MILGSYIASSSIQEVCYAVLDMINVVIEDRRLPGQRGFSQSHIFGMSHIATLVC